jgi:hypothetical protein
MKLLEKLRRKTFKSMEKYEATMEDYVDRIMDDFTEQANHHAENSYQPFMYYEMYERCEALSIPFSIKLYYAVMLKMEELNLKPVQRRNFQEFHLLVSWSDYADGSEDHLDEHTVLKNAHMSQVRNPLARWIKWKETK